MTIYICPNTACAWHGEAKNSDVNFAQVMCGECGTLLTGEPGTEANSVEPKGQFRVRQAEEQ